jgi:hypothetical protein
MVSDSWAGAIMAYTHSIYIPNIYHTCIYWRQGPGWLNELGHTIFESVNICLKHFVKVSAVDKGRFRFTISWHIIVSDFVTAFRRSISLLVMFGLLIKVFIERQFCFTFARSMWFLVPTWRRTSLLSPWAHAMSMAQTVEWKNVSPFFDAQIKFHVS